MACDGGDVESVVDSFKKYFFEKRRPATQISPAVARLQAQPQDKARGRTDGQTKPCALFSKPVSEKGVVVDHIAVLSTDTGVRKDGVFREEAPVQSVCRYRYAGRTSSPGSRRGELNSSDCPDAANDIL